MLKMTRPLAVVAAFGFSASAHAADLYEPPVVDFPPMKVIEKHVPVGGWYLRGDLNYHWSKLRGTEYITYGCIGGSCSGGADPGTDSFDLADLDGAMSLGGGVGYQFSQYLRTDFTVDYWFKSDFRGSTSGEFCGGGACTSTDESAYSALLLMANAYVDLGTYHGITPYLGAGIGGAYVMWDDLVNTTGSGSVRHEGTDGWRFAWSLMAGASYCLTENMELDAGYRFTQISGGRMFEYASGVAPGFEDGFNVHEARAGLRYSFGGSNPRCTVPQVVAYEPPVQYEQPVYK